MERIAERSKPTMGSPEPMPGAQKAKYRGWEVTTLPDDLVINILAKLSIGDLLVCKHVCKYWQSLVTTVPALACAAYRSCHPMGYVPRLSDVLKSYHGPLRQWLNGFSEPGRAAVTRLDGFLADGKPHFPERLFFAIANLLDETSAFECRKVCTIEHPKSVCSACFSPDEQHLVSYSDHAVHICNLAGGCRQNVETFPQPTPVLSANFSSNSKYVVAHLENGPGKIWAFADRRWQQQADWHPAFLRSCPLFSADTIHLVTVCKNDKAQIYGLVDGQWQPQATALDHHPVQCALFHPKEPDLLATYYHNTVTLWHSIDGQWQQGSTLPHTFMIFNIKFSPDGNRLMTHSRGPEAKVSIHVWCREGREWREDAAFPPLYTRNRARFSPCGGYILTTPGKGCMEETYRLSGKQWEKIKIPLYEPSNNGCVSPDDQHLVTQGVMYGTIIWRCMEGLLLRQAVIPDSILQAAASFAPHCNHLVATKSKETAIIWGIFAGRWQEKATLPHAHQLCSMHFSPHGSYILTTTWEGSVTVWSLHSQ